MEPVSLCHLNRPLLSTWIQIVPAAQNTQLVFGSQAQIFCHKHSQDLGQVQHCGAMHVLLRVIKCVPELWEGGADEVQHWDALAGVKNRQEKDIFKTFATD